MLCQKKTDIERIDSSINANGISAKSMIGAPRMITLIYFLFNRFISIRKKYGWTPTFYL
jgi:hypothetical protein